MFSKFNNRLQTSFKKLNINIKYLIILCLSLIIIYLIAIIYKNRQSHQLHENFVVNNEIVKKTGAVEIYDDFYAEIYDQLFQSDLKNEYECVQLQKLFLKDWKGPKIKILDAGCGTGHHLRILQRYGHHVEGLDLSKQMLKKAKRQCPQAILRKGNFDDPKIYESRRFTHILCLFFTIYYSKNLTKLFENFNRWLQPQGMLFIHVVVRDKFDPVLERASSLIPLFDPQRHNKERNTITQLEFKEFAYESDWDLKKPKSKFQEIIRFKNEPYDRQHIHNFHLVNPKSIIMRANRNGFELVKAIDLFLAGHNHNYLMAFRKKYGE